MPRRPPESLQRLRHNEPHAFADLTSLQPTSPGLVPQLDRFVDAVTVQVPSPPRLPRSSCSPFAFSTCASSPSDDQLSHSVCICFNFVVDGAFLCSGAGPLGLDRPRAMPEFSTNNRRARNLGEKHSHRDTVLSGAAPIPTQLLPFSLSK